MPTTATEMMTAPAIVVAPETGIADVARLLSSKQISGVPVCGPDGVLLGIVSEGDIIKPFREYVKSRRDWWLGMIAEGGSMSQSFLDAIRPDNRTAGEMMVRHVIAVEEDATLPRIAELMVRHRIKRLPVLRDGKVVGIVSRSDLVKAVAEAPAMLI